MLREVSEFVWRMGIRTVFLRHMSADVLERLHLRKVDLPFRQDIEVPGQRIERMIFLEKVSPP